MSDVDEHHLGKVPGRYNERAGDWRGLGGAYITTGLHKGDFDAFKSWPTPNAGILGRFAPAIDVDAESEDGRRFVERALIRTFGNNANYATRYRGNGPRRLFAFKAADPDDPDVWVRTRRLAFRLKGESETAKPHKIDVQGYGTHYVVTGIHPSGDKYEWDAQWDLADLFATREIEVIDNNDVARFVDVLREMLEDEGGELLRSTGGRAPDDDRDFSDQDPIFDVREIFKGLDRLPNTPENFATRDEFVSMLASIRAALGREAEAERDQVEAWACAYEDPTWCDAEFFGKAWDSLERGVRVDRESLDRRFKRAGIFVSAQVEFSEAGPADMREIQKAKFKQSNAATELVKKVRSRYVFGHVNHRTGNKIPQMRSVWDPSREWPVQDWWRHETTQQDVGLVQELRGIERWAAPKQGVWTFLRDLERSYADSFYTGETRHPLYPRGAIVCEENPDGTFTREINMRFESRVQLCAKRPPSNPQQALCDLETVLEFVNRVFGELAHYELDTLAYMVQSGKRPGHMLFLVGGQGVGKSIYAEMLIFMFDGRGKEINSRIDGTKLTNESARRFALAKTEGCRIISVKELPEGSTAHNMAQITSSIKQIVDPGPDGDFIQIEAKGKDTRTVPNHARIIVTSNYKNAVQIEEQDRRIFYVSCGIIPEDKPEPDYYTALADVTTNPERLATFWRYLQTREVSLYRPESPPPVSREKLEAQLASTADPLERHMKGALETLRQAKRWIFDTKELGALMTAMSQNECRNTNRSVDDRQEYDFGKMPSAVKRLDRYAMKIRVVKSNGERVATVYGLRTARLDIEALRGASGPEVMEALTRDREQNRLSSDHVWSVFSGPLKAVGGGR